MDPILHEWGGFLIRWTHVVTAIAWIGASFYFMHLDASLRSIAEIPDGIDWFVGRTSGDEKAGGF